MIGDDKNKKRKETKISQNRYISRICREAPTPWTDSIPVLYVERYGGHNHVCQFGCW